MAQLWYHSLTIDHTKVPADVTNMSVVLTAAQFSTPFKTLNGSQAPQSTGSDVRFYSDSRLTTQLAFDLVTFTLNATPANSVIEVVVQVASVSSSTDTVFYVGWGDTSLALLATTATYGQFNAYKSGFKLWCPMKDDPDTSHVKDRTSNQNSGVKKGANAPATGTAGGVINQYQNFTGSSGHYIDFTAFNTGTQFIVFVPFIHPGTGAKDRMVSNKTAYNSTGFEVTLGNASKTILSTRGGTDTNADNISFNDITTDGWETTAARYNNTTVDTFVNGTKVTSGATIGAVANTAAALTVGYNSAHNDSPFTGYIDMVIIYLGTLTDAEISAMQNNQRSPGTFITTGTTTARNTDFLPFFFLNNR